MSKTKYDEEWKEIWTSTRNYVDTNCPEENSWYKSLDDKEKQLLELYCKAFIVPWLAIMNLELKPIEIENTPTLVVHWEHEHTTLGVDEQQ